MHTGIVFLKESLSRTGKCTGRIFLVKFYLVGINKISRATIVLRIMCGQVGFWWSWIFYVMLVLTLDPNDCTSLA